MQRTWIPASFLLVALLAPDAHAAPPAKGLLGARAGFVTQAAKSGYVAQDPAPAPPAGWSLVRYRSGASSLAAYVTPDPRDGKRYPAVVWAHGGFGGIGLPTLKLVEPLAAAGIVVMCPSWRGENDNPGRHEMFYGEVDDALAAVEHVSKLPYVDPERLYFAGHSTGGTLALLVAESTERLRAIYSLGGASDLERSVASGDYEDEMPFPPGRPREVELRSAIRFVSEIKTPTFYFEGQRVADLGADALRMAEAARPKQVPFSAHTIPAGDHFSIVAPLVSLIAKKIREDSPAITPEEARAAFAASRPAPVLRHAASKFEMKPESLGADVCVAVPEGSEDADACEDLDPAAARAEMATHVKPPAELVGLAFVRFDEWTSIVTTLFMKEPITLDTARTRDEFFGGMKSTLVKATGGRLRGDAPGSEYDTVVVSGRPAIKSNLEVSAPAGSPEAAFSRTVVYVVPGAGGAMLVQFNGGEEHLADLQRFAAATIATVHIDAPHARPRALNTARFLGRAIGPLVPFVLMVIGALVGLVFSRRKNASKS